MFVTVPVLADPPLSTYNPIPLVIIFPDPCESGFAFTITFAAIVVVTLFAKEDNKFCPK